MLYYQLMDQDKRVAPRFSFVEPVSYGVPEVNVSGSLASNISLSGISLRVQGIVPVGTILELQIRLGQSTQVTWAKAKVVRIREVLSEDCFEIGLQFIRDEECTKAVGRYVNSLRDEQ